ncbi:MAG: hypothetical protein M9926_09545 [Lentimicrobium sp.]|uniref:hypothetical protein n=1 Tax=Lentimicrobium sp. TaxID=2034841 RepID=UPI0025F09756|nr:hypothetical protein [Lentimicrobium sp.]MCO5256991.1 hypothetical protein [Lentimicrobium sp.]MCO5261288.1 hypothetical protein [Lentimicrobium sp.]HPF64604.1 hypothetical protein [Lentimicrobium sp.]HPJ62072.1 hypothetical protein [Lentimicrobium sp.]HRW69354.1 hypothetical protein [Lentimicrobium sp.]
MKLFSVFAVSALNLALAVYYYRLISKNKIRPSLAMWVFFTLAVGMSLFTYIREDSHSIWDNVLNTTDLVFVSAVTVSILLFGDHTTRFNRFDLFCLGAVTLIIAFWLITQNHLITNLLVQGILVIAYFPVVNRMLHTGENHESYLIWGGMLLTALLALLSVDGELALIYTLRAVISILLLIGLMYYTDRRKKQDIAPGGTI